MTNDSRESPFSSFAMSDDQPSDPAAPAPSSSSSRAITPADVIAYALAKETVGSTDHPAISIGQSRQISLLISREDESGHNTAVVMPYVRLNAAVLEPSIIKASFGDWLVTLFRPQQPDYPDTNGIALLAALLAGFQDQTLRSVRQIPDELEVRWEEVEKDGDGGD